MYKEYEWNNKNVCSTEYIYPALVEICREYHSETILDMGCGNGEIANKLIEEGFAVCGVDGSKVGISIANKSHPAHFWVMDFEKDVLPEPLRNMHFDAIISTEVIEHMYSPQRYVELCRKILMSCGGCMLYITTPYHGYFKNLIMALTGKLDAHFTALWEGGHIKFWSKKTITKLLETYGFRVLKTKGCGRVPYLWKSMLVVAEVENKRDE